MVLFPRPNDRMKKFAILAALLGTAFTADAGTIAIKNDTRAQQNITVVQGGKIKGYAKRLKRNKTLLAKIDDNGPKPVIVVEVLGNKEYLTVVPKTRTYKVSWLLDLMY